MNGKSKLTVGNFCGETVVKEEQMRRGNLLRGRIYITKYLIESVHGIILNERQKIRKFRYENRSSGDLLFFFIFLRVLKYRLKQS